MQININAINPLTTPFITFTATVVGELNLLRAASDAASISEASFSAARFSASCSALRSFSATAASCLAC